MLLSDEEKHDICRLHQGGADWSDDDYDSAMSFIDKAEAALLAKLQAMEMPEPESFEAWNAKQHGDPEEIGFLQALRIAYCCGQDSAKAQQAHAQGYAKGAAEQLSAEPVGRVYNNHQGSWALLNVQAKDDTPLYTRKEAK